MTCTCEWLQAESLISKLPENFVLVEDEVQARPAGHWEFVLGFWRNQRQLSSILLHQTQVCILAATS